MIHNRYDALGILDVCLLPFLDPRPRTAGDASSRHRACRSSCFNPRPRTAGQQELATLASTTERTISRAVTLYLNGSPAKAYKSLILTLNRHKSDWNSHRTKSIDSSGLPDEAL